MNSLCRLATRNQRNGRLRQEASRAGANASGSSEAGEATLWVTRDRGAELIVTTSVANSARYLMRKTDVYYIDDADLSLFAKPIPARPPTPTREYRVEGSR